VLAHGRDADDLDAEVEVQRHPADDGQLLVVLLAEDRDVGPYGEEELGDDGRDPSEVARPERALHRLTERPGIDVGLEAGGVHGRRGRHVERVDAGFLAAPLVVLDRPGYWSKSARWLNWIG
jgi:hypothetical protein